MGTDKMILRHVHDKPFTVRHPDRSEWKDGFQPDGKGGPISHTDVSETNEVTEAGIYGYAAKQKLSFSIGQYTSLFQTEVYAIKHAQ
jgi:hypothetical protein